MISEIKVSNKYKILHKIGSGSFGDVHLGVDMETNKEVALKFVTSI